MSNEEVIEANASRLEEDAQSLDFAIKALERNGAPPRLVSDLAKRRDEWEQQVEDMRERARG